MCHYKYLILSEREKILYFQAKNYSITAIANAAGIDKSTISRELRRNTEEKQYLPASAQPEICPAAKAELIAGIGKFGAGRYCLVDQHDCILTV